MTKGWQEAISSGDAERVGSLLDAGADINALDRHGQTALMRAAHKGHTGVVRLLARCGANLNHAAKYRLTATMLAVTGDYPDVVRVLVDAGDLTLRRSPSSAPVYDKTALEMAGQMKRQQCAELLQHAEGKQRTCSYTLTEPAAQADMKKIKTSLLASRNLMRMKQLRVAGFGSTPLAGFEVTE